MNRQTRRISTSAERKGAGQTMHRVLAQHKPSPRKRRLSMASVGAFGIDGCAHRGALAVAGTTVAVLPCRVDRAYPVAHAAMFRSIQQEGALVSEWPPGWMATKPGLLVRNRVIMHSLGVQN